jgi:hypothetical protein
MLRELFISFYIFEPFIFIIKRGKKLMKGRERSMAIKTGINKQGW